MFELIKKFRNIAIRTTLTDETDSLYVMEGLMIVLETIAERNSAQLAIVDENLLQFLFDFVDFRTMESDEEIPEDAPTSYASVRVAFSKIVTNITMCDANMLRLSQDAEVVDKFKQWMTAGYDNAAIKREEPIRMAGALCIGNLARSGKFFHNE